ncbi:MAG TPA: hypothetical protein PLD20_11020 [Blastocatellia bacterium]|nr:hypothetical protein [Blastocatellia bacterium]HMV85180.1 hypothetical protein [Blastocatellia bacterium]HMY71278.1 hypothetical protein [Blastocatellia bacterium]HMZ18453.1 hypothetical protein [Blastocatellia bacterium]HNG28716.1 hypothetical protein [Blastocatellia bacterium]
MLSPIVSPTTLRPVTLDLHGSGADLCYGVPSCAPLVQHELLKSVRERMPQAYTRATRELGVTVQSTQAVLERSSPIISAARAIKLARLIAYEPNAREVFGVAGQNLFGTIGRTFPGLVKSTIRALPRGLRARLALSYTKRAAYGFAGSVHRIESTNTPRGVIVSIRKGVFADRLETLGGAHSYYRNILEQMFQEFAHVDCEVNEIRRPRVYLDQCHYEIVWEA